MITLVLVAYAPHTLGASSIAQGFRADGEVVPGALVSTLRDSPDIVTASSLGDADLLIGVAGEGSAIELSDGSSTVQVVRSGVALAIVSDINGRIATGDHITASPIKGVGMRTSEGGMVVGIAQAGLEDTEVNERQITDLQGRQQTVRIGLVPVQINASFYTGESSSASFVPSIVQDIAESVAGKQVSPVRILVAALVLVILFFSAVVLLYSATKSSIISIGRNPLSERAVHRSLFEVGLTVVGILAFTVILVYLILTL